MAKLRPRTLRVPMAVVQLTALEIQQNALKTCAEKLSSQVLSNLDNRQGPQSGVALRHLDNILSYTDIYSTQHKIAQGLLTGSALQCEKEDASVKLGDTCYDIRWFLDLVLYNFFEDLEAQMQAFKRELFRDLLKLKEACIRVIISHLYVQLFTLAYFLIVTRQIPSICSVLFPYLYIISQLPTDARFLTLSAVLASANIPIRGYFLRHPLLVYRVFTCPAKLKTARNDIERLRRAVENRESLCSSQFGDLAAFLRPGNSRHKKGIGSLPWDVLNKVWSPDHQMMENCKKGAEASNKKQEQSRLGGLWYGVSKWADMGGKNNM
ncbi:hypothetical protein QBC44DRAFT_370935 [Cladorrhinum sp. PSN332]|nr:hypothetical protein QBC44DRAFT_370935 [Cladorrhinum sp. PSN332]